MDQQFTPTQEQALRLSLPAASRQIMELAKTSDKITVKEIKEIEDSTGTNRNTIEVHVKKQPARNTTSGKSAKAAVHGTPLEIDAAHQLFSPSKPPMNPYAFAVTFSNGALKSVAFSTVS